MNDWTQRLSHTQKRNWFAREAIQSTLSGLGLPAAMDGTHIIFRGPQVERIASWLMMSADEDVAAMLGSPTEQFASVLKAFTNAVAPVSVTHIVSPGVSFTHRGPVLDGAAMRVRFATRNANEGPEAFIIPVERRMLNNGSEWLELVALVPKRALHRWYGAMTAADRAVRSLQVSSMTLRVFNGPDVRIQSSNLDDLVLDPTVSSAFVQDIEGFLTRRQWYEKRGLPWSRKYVLNGPPGTGKTSLARWAASSLGLPAFSFDFTDQYADGRDFSGFLSYASHCGPAIVLLDDFEKVLAGDNKSHITPHTILTSFSGVGSLDGLIIVVTSNSMGPFNGPMRRRFDAVIEVPLPSAEMRSQYLTRILAEDNVPANAIKELVNQTNDWSFDDLRAVVTSAANAMIARRGSTLTPDDLRAGFRSVRNRRSEEG